MTMPVYSRLVLRRWRFYNVSMMIVLMALCLVASEQVQEDTTAEIEKEVLRLGSKSLPERDASQSRLLGMGRPIVPHLKKFLVHPDVEVRMRVEAILAELTLTAKQALRDTNVPYTLVGRRAAYRVGVLKKLRAARTFSHTSERSRRRFDRHGETG